MTSNLIRLKMNHTMEEIKEVENHAEMLRIIYKPVS